MQIINFKIIRSLVCICFVGSILIGCSDEVPPRSKLAQNVNQVSSTEIIVVTSLEDYPLPSDNRIVSESGRYRVVDDVYNVSGSKVLIPEGSLISGAYQNDGSICRIYWKAIYANNDQKGDMVNWVSLENAAAPSLCSPYRRLKRGDRITIRFVANND